MTTKASGRIGFFSGLCLAMFTLFGVVLALGSLGSLCSEILADEPEIVGRGRIVGFNDRAPYDTTSRISRFTDYPVVEYLDKSGKHQGISDRSGFRGYFSIGDEVRIGKRDGKELVIDFWFRAHQPIKGIVLGLMFIGFAGVYWCKLR